MRSHVRAAWLAGVVHFAFAISGYAQHPNLQVGFKPEQAYQIGEVDSINLFNGNLTLQIPLGTPYPVNGGLSYSFSVAYNSKVWDYGFEMFVTCKSPYEDVRVPAASPAARSNAGLGFRLSFGELNPPWTTRNAFSQWVYVSPDGSEHRFYQTLLPGEYDTDGSVW
ncbi:hypothetical protein HRbin09_01423 [bacterium HR09]|nr:hypothetical protein HRbin09_01423 [bacterium HR09]